jgi:hypothetical protein
MASAQEQVNSSPLLVQLLLEFVGVGHSLYITTISKAWHACYTTLHTGAPLLLEGEVVELSSCTSYAAAFASASRVLMASECGLGLLLLADHKMQHCAGRYADIATLLELQAIGVNIANPWISYGAAESNDVTKLRWLREEQKAVFPEDIAQTAAAAGSMAALR